MTSIRRRENHDSGMTRPAWSPFEMTRDPWAMMREMMRWDPLQGLMGPSFAGAPSLIPRFDLKETDDAFVLEADLPGVKEEDLDVSLEGSALTISGERKQERREEGDRVHLYECSYGSFARTFQVPEGVERDAIQAELKEGVLTLRLPKKSEARPRRFRLFGRKKEENEA